MRERERKKKTASKVFLSHYIISPHHLLEISVPIIKTILEVFMLPPQIFIAFGLEMTYFCLLLISSGKVSVAFQVVMKGLELNYGEVPRCF